MRREIDFIAIKRFGYSLEEKKQINNRVILLSEKTLLFIEQDYSIKQIKVYIYIL